MKVGDIIRRVTRLNRIPVGAYIKVTSIQKGRAFGKYLNGLDEFFICEETSDNFIIIKVVRLQLCRETMTRVLNNDTWVIDHPLTKQWDNLCREYSVQKAIAVNHILVCLYDNVGHKLYCTIGSVKKMCKKYTLDKDLYVRLFIENKIFVK